MFKASPGNILVLLDYDFIELCTLAAVCKQRFGFSVLADVIEKVFLLSFNCHFLTYLLFQNHSFFIFQGLSLGFFVSSK
jgi:hypothetical protein